MKNITELVKDRKIQVFIFLLLLLFYAFLIEPQIQFLLYPFLSIFFVVILDLLLVVIKEVPTLWSGFRFGDIWRKIHFPTSSLVTGLLIGLLLSPEDGLGAIFLASLLAVISKHFIHFTNRHIFNPTAFGVFFSSIITSSAVSWWAVSKTSFSPFIILFFGFYILQKFRRLLISLLFLLFYAAYLFIISSGNLDSLRLVFDQTVFLFTFIMLPEPMTSPNKGFWKYFYGILVVIYIWVLSLWRTDTIDLFLLSLLLTNLTARLFSFF